MRPRRVTVRLAAWLAQLLRTALLGVLASLWMAAATAAQPAPAAVAVAVAVAVDTDRLHALTSELRCLVCQNESLADSTAPLALDLKREIRTRMASGDTDAQIKTFLVERYGDFVTYRPPFSARTLLLWLGPLLLVGVGGAVVWRHTQHNGHNEYSAASARAAESVSTSVSTSTPASTPASTPEAAA